MKFFEKMKQKKADNKGFSLVELIIVIAIMAILVGIVGTQVIPYLNKSKESKDLQIINSYSTAAMTAYSSNAGSITIPTPVSGDAKIEVLVHTSTAGDEGTLATAIKELTYNSIPSGKFTSEEGAKIKNIKVTYNFTAKTITTQAYSDDACTTGNEILDPVVSDM